MSSSQHYALIDLAKEKLDADLQVSLYFSGIGWVKAKSVENDGLLVTIVANNERTTVIDLGQLVGIIFN